KRIVLWAVAPDGTFTRLGQVVNTRNRNEAQIQTETQLKDFGLLVTLEDKNEVPNPSGPIFATVIMDNSK
ncbi:MAG: anti-sigma factor, partial [Acidobacteriota bacterium]|nr:anti-sigma factor [Acidobacteriota bacterium]